MAKREKKTGEVVAEPKPKRGPGRPRYEPTDLDRAKARLLYSRMASDALVARRLGLDRGTVAKAFRAEKIIGIEESNDKLYGALWNKAVVKKDTACLIFLAKNRLGMSDRQDVKNTGDSPAPRMEFCIKVQYMAASDPGALPPPPAERLLPSPPQSGG
jgi:hypothetical protein